MPELEWPSPAEYGGVVKSETITVPDAGHISLDLPLALQDVRGDPVVIWYSTNVSRVDVPPAERRCPAESKGR